MIKLINGRGQLGTALQNYINTYGDPTPNDIEYLIYHTWNIDDQCEETQKNEYGKFINFVDKNCDNKIIFISTLHEKEGFYLQYKMKAESYLRFHDCDYKIYRIPYMIGKGLCHKIVHNKYNPYPGKIEISTLSNMSGQIIETINNDKEFECLHGELLHVNTLKEALLYDRA